MSEVDDDWVRLAEATIFASSAPVSRRALGQLLPDEADTDAVVAALQARYEGRGVELVEAGGGLQVLLNRSPEGWNVTLINNHGVVKQPGTAETVDARQARAATVVLRPGFGVVVAAWAGDGQSPAQPIGVEDGRIVRVVVAAGQLQLIRLVVKNA